MIQGLIFGELYGRKVPRLQQTLYGGRRHRRVPGLRRAPPSDVLPAARALRAERPAYQGTCLGTAARAAGPRAGPRRLRGGTACPACGAGNPPTGLFCQVCGAPLHRGAQGQSQQGQPFSPFGGQPYAAAPPAQNPYSAAFGGLNPSEEIDGVSARDLALYVGENSGYFLPRFKQISQGKPVSFNFCALFFNFFYFFYRKMYSVGLILLGITLARADPHPLRHARGGPFRPRPHERHLRRGEHV